MLTNSIKKVNYNLIDSYSYVTLKIILLVCQI